MESQWIWKMLIKAQSHWHFCDSFANVILSPRLLRARVGAASGCSNKGSVVWEILNFSRFSRGMPAFSKESPTLSHGADQRDLRRLRITRTRSMSKWIKPANYFASAGGLLVEGASQLAKLCAFHPSFSLLPISSCLRCETKRRRGDAIRRFRIKLSPRHKFNESRREAARCR